MTRQEQVESLFHEALALPRDVDRIQWVSDRCEDSALSREVVSLLQAHVAALSSSGAISKPSIPTARFGVYRAVEVLGRGGMSVVYRAERMDGQFDQTVALKVMASYLADPKFLERFELERRLLGALVHHNIARLLDGGVSSIGDPYLVTEYIDGEPVDRYCDDQRLEVSARLRLFLQICEAVDYAHRNLIVHRDLKPANILVSREGTVKLLDFGTASLQSGHQDVTETRMRMLTPRYASPEQLRGDRVNTSTDVFSLGVVLYELLSGAWPFGDPTSRLAEFDRVRGAVTARPPSVAITEESAERRSASHNQLRRVLSGDLSAIVLKALEQDPAARYASVRAFAEDVENHLAGKPVLARPQTLLYRSRRFVRRHWLPVSAIGIGVTVLSLTAGVAVVQARTARHEALKAQTTSKFLQDMLATDNSVDKDITLRAMVDRAETKLNRERILDPLIEAELRLWLAESYISRQEFQKGQHELDRAEALFRASGNIADLARVDSWRAFGLDSSGDRESAQRYLEETIRICRVPRNHADPDTCIQSYVNLLITHAPSLTFEQQKQLVRDAGVVVKAHPDVDPALRSKLLKGESRIAIRERRYSDAGRVLAEALDIDQRQPDPDDNAIAQDFFALADLRFRIGDIKGAADYHRQRMNLFMRASGPDAAVTQHAAANLACVLSYQGNLDEARQLADQAVAKVRDSLEYQKLIPLFSAAMVRNFSGQAAEAEPYAREAARISLKSYPKTTSVYAEHSAELGISLLLQGNVEEALPLLQAADAVFAKLNIPDYPPSGRIHRYYRQAAGLDK